MVEPRMVTARTQNFWRATQFGSGRTERIAASSHGRALGLIMADNHSNEIRHFACRHHTDRKTAEHLHPPPNHRRPPPSSACPGFRRLCRPVEINNPAEAGLNTCSNACAAVINRRTPQPALKELPAREPAVQE